MPKKTHMLIILDGWGIGDDEPTNAVLVADTPCLDRLLAACPSTQLRCAGRDVGYGEAAEAVLSGLSEGLDIRFAPGGLTLEEMEKARILADRKYRAAWWIEKY